MKLASKFIAALAVVASFSSFAADAIDTDALSGVTDLAGAIELAGDASVPTAAIFQVEASNAFISQIGANGAAIIQNVEATAAIIQSGEGNVAVIFQGE
jgi:predicted ThiF/HesA family dinucleotide-utilizing enzyme